MKIFGLRFRFQTLPKKLVFIDVASLQELDSAELLALSPPNDRHAWSRARHRQRNRRPLHAALRQLYTACVISASAGTLVAPHDGNVVTNARAVIT